MYCKCPCYPRVERTGLQRTGLIISHSISATKNIKGSHMRVTLVALLVALGGAPLTAAATDQVDVTKANIALMRTR